MKISDFAIHSLSKLDRVLTNCCELIIEKHRENAEYYGKVAACVIDPSDNHVYAVNYMSDEGTRVHAERAAVNKYIKKYGELPMGCLIVTTLSPCSEDMSERYGESCTHLVNELNVHKVYCGYEDPTQNESDAYIHKKFHVMETRNQKLRELCKKFADTFLDKIETSSK